MVIENHDIESLKSDGQPVITTQQSPRLNRTITDGTFSMSPELYAKLYLSPQNRVKGDLRNTFGNPSPLTLLGLCMSLTPISCDLMGWGGSGGGGAASIGTYFFMGGLLMVAAGILEFFLGNTFPFVVSCGFGGFWLTMGSTMTPGFGAYAAYSPDQSEPLLGFTAPGFLASFAFFFMCMAIFCCICLVCALRTNVVNVLIFLFLAIQYCTLASSYWTEADNMAEKSQKIAIAGGAVGFVAISCGWYLFTAQMLQAVDLPLSLPVGDLSHLIQGASQKQTIDGQEN